MKKGSYICSLFFGLGAADYRTSNECAKAIGDLQSSISECEIIEGVYDLLNLCLYYPEDSYNSAAKSLLVVIPYLSGYTIIRIIDMILDNSVHTHRLANNNLLFRHSAATVFATFCLRYLQYEEKIHVIEALLNRGEKKYRAHRVIGLEVALDALDFLGEKE